MVSDFMRKAGQFQGQATPGVPSLESRLLRVKLIAEELSEFAKASEIHCAISIGGDYFSYHDTYAPHGFDPEPMPVVDAADALADLLYVVYGAAVAWGIHIDPVFGAVHNANMEKFGPGSYSREDGKWLRPPDWTPPNIAAVLRAQGWGDDLGTTTEQAV